MKVFGVDDDAVDWAAYGREAFLQNWRKRAECADRAIAERDEKWEEVKALAEQVADTRRRAERAEAELARLTGRVKHAPDCIGLLAIQSDPTQSHDCRESVGFSNERGNYCKVCDRFILNAELG